MPFSVCPRGVRPPVRTGRLRRKTWYSRWHEEGWASLRTGEEGKRTPTEGTPSVSRAFRCHPCPRSTCAPIEAHRPVRTPARTPRRSGALLHGHRTPGDVRLLAQQMAEVLVGRRAPEKLGRQVTVPVRETLRRLRGSVPCRLAPRLMRVFHQPVRSRAVEVSALITCDHRSRVFAFRARWEGGRWVCEHLEVDGARA